MGFRATLNFRKFALLDLRKFALLDGLNEGFTEVQNSNKNIVNKIKQDVALLTDKFLS